MDFGMLGLDGLVSSEANTNTTVFGSSDPEAKHKWYGSGNLKQERSCIAQDDNGRSSKMLKMDDINNNNNNSNISASKTMLFQQKNNTSFFPEGQQQQQPAEQMLSFTSPRTAQNVTLPYLQYSSSAFNRNTGYNLGSLNGANMHGAVTGTRGPFTPSQWMELEHQALIYKYILANVPVPSNLLIPIKKALESAGFPGISCGILRPSTLGWGSFHLGFSNNTDPEPGRCRRTDGKKWRCSRDAVADQKYCERHMNRGRHRSRKPVEGQNGHSATGTTTNSKLMPTASSASVVATGGASNSLASANQQIKDMQTGASNLAAASSMNRMFLNTENVGDRMLDTPGLSMLSSADLKYKENPFLIGKQQIPCGEFSPAAFGFVSSDSLVNPSHKGNSMINCRNLPSQDPNAEEAGSHSLRHFIDDWPKNQSDRVSVSWPELDVQMQQDRTQLSMSIPMVSADFMSSTSSPNNEKVTLSPLRLSRELDPIQMGLGVGSVANEEQRQPNCMPISWEHSLGGPLGEVLHSTNNSGSDSKNSSSPLNLMTEGWDNNPWTGSSPTGVLQKSTFASLSNSSAGSSPRTENKTHEGASQCKEILNSTPGNPSSVPAL